MASLEVLKGGRVLDRFELSGGEVLSGQVRYLRVDDSGDEPRVGEVQAADAELVLMRTDRHWVLLLPPGVAPIRVSRIPVIGVRILANGDVIEQGGLELVLRQEHVELLGADAELIRQSRSCPVCREDFRAGDRVIYCPVCGLAHHYRGAEGHDDCWSYNGRCASRPFCGHIPKSIAKA